MIPLVVGGLAVLLLAAAALAAIASGLTGRGDQQRAADLAALAAARAMAAAYPQLFEPAVMGGRPNPGHLERSTYLARAREAAEVVAGDNGMKNVVVSFPGADPVAPLRVRVSVMDRLDVGDIAAGTRAEADVVAGAGGPALDGPKGVGEYPGPYAMRQGQPMRPDVARAFDRLAAAAAKDGLTLVIASGYRSDAEQAILFARRPDPRWVARPGTSLHRLGTELDLGPEAAYGWLAAHAGRYGFLKRYAWEAWHFGFVHNAGTSSLGYKADGRTTLPGFVPARFSAAIGVAAQRWNVSAALLSAQLYAESNFNPMAASGAGAVGIAQFTPGTAAAYGLLDRRDPEASIQAQAHLMHDLLRQFASVPLALAAYNAGPGNVAGCMCVPPFPETRAYVAKILGMLGGAGLDAVGGGEMEVRLVA